LTPIDSHLLRICANQSHGTFQQNTFVINQVQKRSSDQNFLTGSYLCGQHMPDRRDDLKLFWSFASSRVSLHLWVNISTKCVLHSLSWLLAFLGIMSSWRNTWPVKFIPTAMMILARSLDPHLPTNTNTAWYRLLPRECMIRPFKTTLTLCSLTF
jgi:hypothetical protein